VCPFCPAARNLVKEVLSANNGVDYEEVNTWTDEGIRRGMALNIMAIPAVVVNGVVKLVGWPFEAADLQKCLDEARS